MHGRSGMRFPGEDGGRSLAEMAQRDLDAALQLLADRAQYITGSSGAAIALRRSGRNDMLCRASTGSNAPELGTLLSTEFGLSGESVRTRQPLRCDDAERDSRVNRKVCSQMGIASVVVMPVVHDDEVLGVFQLFSGKVHAFGERDLSALQRLSEMVETAVRLARAAEEIPERLKTAGASATGDADGVLETEDPVVEVEPENTIAPPPASSQLDAAALSEMTSVRKGFAEDGAPPMMTAAAEAAEIPVAEAMNLPPVTARPESADARSATTPAKKPLLWSAALNLSGDTATLTEVDQSHVPPVLRNLRKCEACGFPVSAERALCVECEEKKWRGQLRMPQASAVRSASGTAAAAAAAPARKVSRDLRGPLPAPATSRPSPSVTRQAIESKQVANESQTLADQAATAALFETPQAPSPDLVFSAAAQAPQSWLARHKFIVGAMLLVAATVAAILLLR